MEGDSPGVEWMGTSPHGYLLPWQAALRTWTAAPPAQKDPLGVRWGISMLLGSPGGSLNSTSLYGSSIQLSGWDHGEETWRTDAVDEIAFPQVSGPQGFLIGRLVRARVPALAASKPLARLADPLEAGANMDTQARDPWRS